MKKIFAVAAVFFLLLAGCRAEEGNGDIPIVLTEKSLPHDFHEIAHKREEVPYYEYLARIAASREESERLYHLYRLKEPMQEVDWDRHALLFLGLYESGSCPMTITSMKYNDSELEIHTGYADIGFGQTSCTDDATVRTFVVQLDKEAVEGIRQVKVVEGDVATALPLEGS